MPSCDTIVPLTITCAAEKPVKTIWLDVNSSSHPPSHFTPVTLLDGIVLARSPAKIKTEY